MRIISGRYRGRRIVGPRGSATRPTSDRVRESLFSILASRYELGDADVLDLFAGSGALGLEALSRGARSAVFVEKNRTACDCIRRNIATLDAVEFSSVVCRGVRAGLSQITGDSQRFNFVFADPPYALDPSFLLDDVSDVMSPGAVLVLEHDKRRAFDAHPEHVMTRDFGSTRVSFFEYL